MSSPHQTRYAGVRESKCSLTIALYITDDRENLRSDTCLLLAKQLLVLLLGLLESVLKEVGV